MRRSRRFWVMVLLACLGLGGAVAAQAASPVRGAIDDPDHVILVMLRAAPDHFRPDQAYGGGYGDQLAASARARIARRIADRHGLAVITNWPMPMLEVDCFLMRVPAARSSDAVAADVSHDRGVAWAQPMHSFHAQGASVRYDDPLYPAEPAASLWHLSELHGVATGRGVTIALIDSKVDAAHPDIAGQILLERDFTGRTGDAPEAHGTGVAGVIAARGGNHVGIVGVAPGARILALRACWQDHGIRTVCDSFSLAKALQFAIERKVGIVNMSLSGPPDLLIERLIAIGLARGSRIVAAVDTGVADGGFPASLPGVVAVTDRKVGGSRNPVYTAPGRDIPTTAPGGKWFIVNGSSYAAAHVTGLLALLAEGRGSGRMAALIPGSGIGSPVNACLTLTRARNGRDCLCASGSC